MEKRPNVFRNRLWLTLGLVGMITVLASGPILAATLTVDEKDDLLYIREEEKLARDVYLVLSQKWGLPIFDNISKSEQTHMDAIKVLLDRYGLDDPVKDDIGVFTNKELQALYDDLISSGTNSVTAALNVGVFIEKTDIEDLTLALTNVLPAHKDIKRVYENLRNGSYNHLDAFQSQLNQP